jgi:membrane-bound lytic murein transglycosylase D
VHAANNDDDVWEVLRNQLSINHEVTQPLVQEQIRWLSAHPSYLQDVARKSEPYIYHILTEIKKRNLPGELALIPIIESAFDPFAYSGAGAAGLWQIMPDTANELGLKRDWWFDGRRSVGPSTDAALNYLVYLNKFFNGNWALAIAAYDAGEGTIGKAIKAKHYTINSASFWKLSVPRETRAYVPRLLALAEIIKNPQRYKVKLPTIPYLPYFREVNIGSQIDLNHAAKLAGITYTELIKLNPGFNRWATAPNQPHKLLIPTEKVARFNRNLANVPKDKRVSWVRYQVKRRDTLANIAQRNHTNVILIKQLNTLKSEKLHLGQSILIPNKSILVKNEPIKSALPILKLEKKRVIHIVQTTDTYQNLEKTYGVLASEIRTWNKLAATMPLKRGQQLVIWKTASSSKKQSA